MKLYVTTLVVLGLVANALGYYPADYIPPSAGGSGSATFGAKANCPNSNARLFMEFNDVRALIEVGGSLWQDRANGAAAYFVPAESNTTVIFAGAIWMGGKDVNGQLKLAALTFRSGNDFWPGPLSVNIGSGNIQPGVAVGDNAIRDFGAATIDPDVCIEYDQFFSIAKSEVIQFSLQYECSQTPGCEEVYNVSADAINRINNWPAHGDVSRGQDFYLAPFYDRNQNGVYEPTLGEYPWFDDILNRDDVLCGSDRRVTLFGDQTNWWIFNDKGNIHTESGGDPIGMEIHAQAFSFATNDEVNKMTFYNYEMINRSTQTLQETYFSQYVDADIGLANDDFAGCDVSRGLGFMYNGVDFDPGQNGNGYGENVPAVGIDFFEGPYQDPDGIDNPGPRTEEVNGQSVFVQPSVAEALAQDGIVYKGIGIGYSDGIVDNERFGMRRFNYYTNGANAGQGDPRNNFPTDFYNYMSGFWRDGTDNFFGGSGYPGSNGVTTIPSDFMFPGDSDPLFWGTAGVPTTYNWSETQTTAAGASNQPGDRRFVQSAGPFTLKPGATNNLTVGVIYGRSFSGDAFESVAAVKIADTKAQALFDNCFRILDPPSAPVLQIQELENELVLMVSNPFGNNVNEEYIEEDNINIVEPPGVTYDKNYRFEGYQIYQMIDDEASVADIGDIDKARLVAQCDIENDVEELINYEFNEELGVAVPSLKVNGANEGIQHSFLLTEDAFAAGTNKTLVNHRTYYYIAIAYAYNNYKNYDPTDPGSLDGQQMPYISSRLAADGSAIRPVIGIPHDPIAEADGTLTSLRYGDSPQIKRLDGTGNGGFAVDLTQESVDNIFANGSMATPTYTTSGAPIKVKVIDPLSLADGIFRLRFFNQGDEYMEDAEWVIDRIVDGNIVESVTSERTIEINNEQLITDWGISVQIRQVNYNESLPFSEGKSYAAPIEATIEFADSSKRWMIGVPDNDGFSPFNWISAGDYVPETDNTDPNLDCYQDIDPATSDDSGREYAQLLGGTVTLGQYARGNECEFSPIGCGTGYQTESNWRTTARNDLGGGAQPSVDIIITADKSKWTRCPVIELNNDENLSVGGAKPGTLRESPSVDKEGRKPGDAGYNEFEATNGGAQPTGMGWFPGYAIDVEKGRRLNMAFTENSFLAGEGGADMVWNPSETFASNIGTPRLGGQQLVYVLGGSENDMPVYSQDQNYVYDLLSQESTSTYRDFYGSLSWVLYPIKAPGQDLLSTDVKIRLRIEKTYQEYFATGENGGAPMYEWDMSTFRTITGDQDALASVLDLINVVPNPYYAFSQYENDRLDTRVKITNLPERCLVRIYNTSGKLVKTFKKDDPLTSIDWDMKNDEFIPIASGSYLIHVEVEGIGETVVKFFCGMRQPDLENI